MSWTLEATHVYRSAVGRVTLRVEKYRKPDGGKVPVPYVFGPEGREVYGFGGAWHVEGRKFGRDVWLPVDSADDPDAPPSGHPSAHWVPRWQRCLYRLPDLAAELETEPDRFVFVCEGEKDADRVASLGLCATTNYGGAKSFKAEDAEALQALDVRHVVVVEDNDQAGRERTEAVGHLLWGFCETVKVLRFTELPEHGDLSDFLDALPVAEREADGARAALLRRLDRAPFYEPPAPEEPLAEAEDEEDTEAHDGKGEKVPGGLERLLTLTEGCRFFQGTDGAAYVQFPKGESFITTLVNASLFQSWLRSAFYLQGKETNGKALLAPSRNALEAALRTLEAKALFEPDMPGKREVALRSAGRYDEGGTPTAIYIDLANERGEVVEVTAADVRVLTAPPEGVVFLRTDQQHALPSPDANGTLGDLLPLLRTESLQEQAFVLAWLVFAFHPKGPFPVLALLGPAGSGKTTLARLLRSLIDPVAAPLRRPPKTLEDYFIAARTGRVLALENVSRLSDAVSDTLCSIATGAAIGARTLYTNADETAFEVRRPILLNGIDEFVTRGDLASRTLKVHVPAMPRGARATEGQIEREIEALRPRLFGGICRALQEALKHPDHRADDLPRMADFANFIDAAQAAFPADVPPLIEAMANLHDQMAHERAAASPVSAALLTALRKTDDGRLEGDMTAWHASLKRYSPGGTAWPRNVQAFRSALRRDEPVLMHLGVNIMPDGKDPVTRRACYVATLQERAEVERNPSDRSDPSEEIENVPETTTNGTSEVQDCRRIGEASKKNGVKTSKHPSEDNLQERSGKEVFEGSKDAKNPAPNVEKSLFRPGTRVRHPDGFEGTATSDVRDGRQAVYVGLGAEARTIYADVADLEPVFST